MNKINSQGGTIKSNFFRINFTFLRVIFQLQHDFTISDDFSMEPTERQHQTSLKML